MIKIEAITLEEAYSQASSKLKCSVTQLQTEVIQYPYPGVLGMFKKTAIIVAVKKSEEEVSDVKNIKKEEVKQTKEQNKKSNKPEKEKTEIVDKVENLIKKVTFKHETKKDKKSTKKGSLFGMLNDTIMPTSFVSTQDEDKEITDEKTDEKDEISLANENKQFLDIAKTIKEEINALFNLSCFEIDEINVSIYDGHTLLIEFQGADSALLIGKEGYRYKALSYMLFNWINTKYQIQLRLEIAEFLKNQEESISRYLINVCENIDRDGKAQTKILDGVLVQIALKELRDTYPEKYVAIRSTRDGLKYIIINDYLTHTKYD